MLIEGINGSLWCDEEATSLISLNNVELTAIDKG